MELKKDDKKVNRFTKKYNTLSILEKDIYSKAADYKPQFTNRSIMEIAVYYPTAHERKKLWQELRKRLNIQTKKEL